MATSQTEEAIDNKPESVESGTVLENGSEKSETKEPAATEAPADGTTSKQNAEETQDGKTAEEKTDSKGSGTAQESQVLDLSTESFKAFCGDISAMFSIGMKCEKQEAATVTVEVLRERFKNLAAVTGAKADGAFEGTFQIILSREGLFTLAGAIAMPAQMTSLLDKCVGPEKTMENIKSGSLKEAEEVSDTVAEACNLLIGSWDRVFREGLEGHKHLLQTRTFVGDPWDNPKEKTGLSNDEEYLFTSYKITISSYPAFDCGVVFPKSIFAEVNPEVKVKAETETKAKAEAEEKAKAEAEAKAKAEAEVKAKAEVEEKAKTETETKAEATEEKDKPEAEAREEIEEKDKPKAEVKTEAEENTEARPETTDQPKAEPEAKAEVAEEKDKPETEARKETEEKGESKAEVKAEAEAKPHTEEKTSASAQGQEPKKGEVSETIQKMTQSPEILPGESDKATITDICVSSEVCATDIMQKEVVWATSEESVEQALTKMQQRDSGYIMIGKDGILEGIVSKSDITGATSIYLRPIFAKWYGPLDDATLQIKLKWIMSRPVRTVRPETPLATIIENFCRFGGRGLPVVDEQGKVQGLVTVFDIFRTLLNTSDNVSTVGKTAEVPALV